MKFCFSETMCDPAHLVPLAIEADRAGYASFGLPDSICYPEEAAGDYPYNEDGSREFLDGAPFIDPFVLAASMAAVTERIVFETGVVKLPIRNPVLVAKTVSSLAVLSKDRFVFGVGLSPWIEDFQVVGQDWKTRGKRMGEMIEIIRGLMSGEYFSYRSEHYDIPRIKLCPVPAQPVKILYGGHSDAAYRRAARLCDGFYFTGASEAEVVERMAKIDAYRREYGTDAKPFAIHAGLPFSGLDDIKRLEDLGVSQLVFGTRPGYTPDTLSLEQKQDILRRFADDVIAKQ